MNHYSKIKKKLQKNKKILKKKAVTAAELVAAGTLLTAGSTIIEKISEDPDPQITASEVTSAIRAIRRVINVCGDRTRTYSPNEEQSEDKKEQKTEGKYSAVVYTPSPAEHESKDPNSKPINTMAKFQKKLDNEIDILYKESRNGD